MDARVRRHRRILWCVAALTLAAVLPAALCPGAAKKLRRDDWQQAARVVADLGLKPGSIIADVGCGRGYFTFQLAKAVGAGGKVFAEDVDAKALKSIEDRIAKDNLANIVVVKGVDADTKLQDESLDAALFANVFHHVPKQHRPGLAKDVVRALKPGGYFFLIDWTFDAKVPYDKGRRIPRDDLLKLGAEAGLKLDAEFLYLEHQVFLRFRKPTTPK